MKQNRILGPIGRLNQSLPPMPVRRRRVAGPRRGPSRKRAAKPVDPVVAAHLERSGAWKLELEKKLEQSRLWLEAQAPLKRVDRVRPSG